MASNRDLWPETFTIENFPAFPCPRCRAGRLTLDKESYRRANCGESDRALSGWGYSPEEDFGRFTCLLVCSARNCGEVVGVIGSFQEHQAYDARGDITHETGLYPQSMIPGPPLMDIPANTPPPAAEAIRQSFSAFWGDRGSAANRLRISVERIMDSEGISAKGASGDLKLYRRIELFGEKHPDFKETLDALRYVGNLGSHDGDVTREALLDAFEVYQEWLRSFYGKYKDRIDGLVKKLIATKGKYA